MDNQILADLKELASVSNTMFIPLKGRSMARPEHHDFSDPWARELFEKYPIPSPEISRPTIGFSICRAKWLDQWARNLLANGGTLIQLGPGLCSRSLRLGLERPTLEIDLPGVIKLKKKLYQFPKHVHLEDISFFDPSWTKRAKEIGPHPYVIVMEGVSMYLQPNDFKQIIADASQAFKGQAHFLFDYINPILARHTILLPSVYKTGARFSGNGFYRWQLKDIHPRAKVAQQLALPRLYLPKPWSILGEACDWYSLGHLEL